MQNMHYESLIATTESHEDAYRLECRLDDVSEVC